MTKKLVIDLDSPVWLSEPGFGGESAFQPPYCALGKAAKCTDGYGLDPHEIFQEIKAALPPGVSFEDIICINDEIVSGQRNTQNHWKAVRFLLEALQAGGKCEFIGTNVSDLKAPEFVA